jgi:outer membrane protein assembly factor BamB
MRRIVVSILLLTASSAHAQEWNRFRGPNGVGVSAAKMPTQWTKDDYLWKVALPGRGHSSPVAWQDDVFVTAADDKTGTRHVLCLDAGSGKTRWQREFADASYKIHKRNSIATATPTVDTERVYVAWATPQHYLVQALDRQTGKDVWKIDLGPFISQHGFGPSPILYEDLLILCNEQDAKSFLTAVETRTGKEVWKLPRNSGNATYATPCVYQPSGRAAELIFSNWQHGITAVEPRTGKVAWEISCFEPKKAERAIGSPIIAGERVIASCGFVTAQKHFVAVVPTNDGNAKEVWRIEKAVAHLATPVVKGDRIYSFTELGIASCIDATTGKVIWQERLDNVFAASPVIAGDAIYAIDLSGEVVVVQASDTFKLLSRNRLGQASQSTPAIAAGRMIFRTEGFLMALGAVK